MKAQEQVLGMIEEHKAEIVKLEELASNIALEIQESYDKGFVDGAGSVGSDVVYTEAELQAKIAEAIAPLNNEILNLQSIVEEIPVKIQQAVSEKVQQIKAKYDEAQGAEKAIEDLFGTELA